MNAEIKFGIVSEVKPGFVRVKFEEDEGIVSDWLPVLVKKSKTDKESFQLETLEHVVCLMDCQCEYGVCLGAIYNEEDVPDAGEAAGKFRKVFEDGTLIEYDKKAHKLTVDVKGSLKAITAGDAEINATGSLKGTATVKATVTAPNIELTGAVKITGAVTILGALSAGAISTVPGAGGGSGNIDVQGTFNLTGDVNATGDVKAGLISLKNHKHISAPSGSPTGPATP